MGFDLIGKKPQTEMGKYFRQSCWGWRPIWNYCRKVAPNIISEKDHQSGQYNDGHFISQEKAEKLAKYLDRAKELGLTQEYEKAYSERISKLPKIICHCCDGNGYRAIPPQTGPGPIPCNGCNSTGYQAHSDSYYPFKTEYVDEFSQFLKDCGGFEIL